VCNRIEMWYAGGGGGDREGDNALNPLGGQGGLNLEQKRPIRGIRSGFCGIEREDISRDEGMTWILDLELGLCLQPAMHI
jgi:hypothetical protein